MATVKQRVKEVKQPRGGYVNPSAFVVITRNDGVELNPVENIPATIIGTVVDYMTRFLTGTPKEKSFEISLKGVELVSNFLEYNNITSDGIKETAHKLFDNIKGLDEMSIICACKLVTYDFFYRNFNASANAPSPQDIEPDKPTVENIITLLNRSVSFIDEYGPIVQGGFSFNPPVENKALYDAMLDTKQGTYGGYTPTVSKGDGDFLSLHTLWDFKVLRSKINSQHTLQLVMYYLMGKHSGQPIFDDIMNVGIFNPRLNEVYILDMETVSEDTIKEIESAVIGYPLS